MKRAKSIFLWCGELVEQWRGWLPYWGFCSKNVRTSIKKHRQNWKSESEAEMRSALRADLISACPIRISIFNHLDFARNNFELCPEHTSRFPSLNRSVCKAF